MAWQFEVNVIGPLALTRALLPDLRKRRGRVLFIGSLAGRLALPFQAHYSASKAAVAALSDALRIELAPHGVAVTCVEPGDFATGFTDARKLAQPAGSPYARAAARCKEAVDRSERQGEDPRKLARLVRRLSEQRRPPRPPPSRPLGAHDRRAAPPAARSLARARDSNRLRGVARRLGPRA